MKKENYCDIEYSRKLGKYFKDAEWWWIKCHNGENLRLIKRRSLAGPRDFYPAITTDMLLASLRFPGEGNPLWREKELKHFLAKLMIWLDENNLLTTPTPKNEEVKR